MPFFQGQDAATGAEVGEGDRLSAALAGLAVDGRGLRKVLDLRVRGGF